MEEKPKRIGRPPRLPPKNAAENIREAASKGASLKELALYLKCHPETLRRWMEENPELKEAFEEGRESERRTLHNRVYEVATKGEGKEALIAAFFLLKARHGYRDNAPEVPSNSVSVNFQIPGAKPFDPDKVIENETGNRTQRLPAATIGRA